MSLKMTNTGLIVATLGIVSFVLGVLAELKLPTAGNRIDGKDVVICTYPPSPSVALGYLSVAFLIASTVTGYMSVFYSYAGKSVPQSVFFRNTIFLCFFGSAWFCTGLATMFLLWPTIGEQLVVAHNVYRNLKETDDCPTAKGGLLGGGAFVSLDSTLFWLVALMLAKNVREDFFDEVDSKVEHGSTTTDDYGTPSHLIGSA